MQKSVLIFTYVDALAIPAVFPYLCRIVDLFERLTARMSVSQKLKS